MGQNRQCSQCEQLKEGYDHQEDHLAMMAHDFKTSLTMLSLQIQLMSKSISACDSTSGAKLICSKARDTMHKEIMLCTKMIDHVMTMPLARAGGLIINEEQFDFCLFLKEVIERFCISLPEQAPAIKLESEDEIHGAWDRLQLERVVVNLLANATKYGANKLVIVKLQKKASQVHLAIEDKGIGIAKKDQKRIFEKFTRAAPKSSRDGFGLGLFIVDNIVRAHGGTITVKSKLGVGSTFTVKLPIKSPSAF